MRAGRKYPSLSDINISDIEEIWHFSFTIDVMNAQHKFQYFGPELVTIFGVDYTGEYVEETMNDIFINNTIGSYLNSIEQKKPTMESASFHYNGKEVRYRTLTVPLSHNGEAIDYVMGTTNYKIF
jgi:hypothetical protein